MIEFITDSSGIEIVYITNDDGSTISMLKSIWDEQQKAIKDNAE